MTFLSTRRKNKGLHIIALTGVWVVLAALCTPAARAEQSARPAPEALTAREVFTRLPIGVLDLLNRSTRLDMLDYFDADSLWSAPNAMEGVSRLNTVKPDYLSLQVTDVSTLAIRILPTKREPVVMVLYTVGSEEEGPDTEVQFFDASLRPLDTGKYLSMPKPGDFLDIPKGTDRKEIEALLPFPTIEWKVSEDAPLLQGRMTLGSHLPLESADRIRPLLKPWLSWTWDGSRWKPRK